MFAAAAGSLGCRRVRRHLCGCQQQVQTDGFWLRQVCVHLSLSLCVFTSQCRLWLLAFVCCSELVVLVVCVHCENVLVYVCRSHLVCACQDLLLGLWSLPGWQEFLSSLLPTCSSFFNSFSLFLNWHIKCFFFPLHNYSPENWLLKLWNISALQIGISVRRDVLF